MKSPHKAWHSYAGFVLTLLLGAVIGGGVVYTTVNPPTSGSSTLNFQVAVTNQSGQPHFTITRTK